jgi:hypothetical protein
MRSAVARDGLLHGVDDPFGDAERRLAVVHVAQHDRELVAAEPGHPVRVAHLGREAGGDDREHAVARRRGRGCR